jgi:hypothetical protein
MMEKPHPCGSDYNRVRLPKAVTKKSFSRLGEVFFKTLRPAWPFAGF